MSGFGHTPMEVIRSCFDLRNTLSIHINILSVSNDVDKVKLICFFGLKLFKFFAELSCELTRWSSERKGEVVQCLGVLQGHPL